MTAIGTVQHASVFIAIALGVYLLHWGKDFLMPLVLSLLLANVLAPAVSALTRRRIPNAVAVTLVTSGLAAVVLGAMLLITREVVQLGAQLPDYRQNIVNKVRAARGSAGDTLTRLTGTLREVSQELKPGTTAPATTSTAVPPTAAVPVKVVESETGTFIGAGLISPLLIPLGNVGIVVGLLFFFLLERDLVAHRLSWLLRQANLGVSSDAIESASTNVGRYLRAQLMVNLSSGCLVFLSMALIGLPNALLLGALAAALRYIPYIGPLVGITLPTVLAIAVFPGWKEPLIALGLLLTIELITNMVMEPLLYGSKTGVSSTGVVVASFFWGWAWGAIGLMMAMPITVWIVIVGRYLPGLRTVAILLNSESIANVEKDGQATDRLIEPREEGWAE